MDYTLEERTYRVDPIGWDPKYDTPTPEKGIFADLYEKLKSLYDKPKPKEQKPN